MADRVGQRLGNYQLIRLLGEGSFAEVYLGEHIHLGTQAAIKVLHTQLTSDDVNKFRTEARTVAHLVHPHIVRVLEFGVEGKTPFLVMDYASRGSLRKLYPRGVTLPLATIVLYVKQVADALQHAHDEKVVHRDVKPENMLLGRRNEVLLSDFGIALIAQSSRYQSTQEMAGTMAYIAPEQIQGKPRPASDQYSLGIVVYEWLSGDRPFHGSLTELVGQHLSVPPPPLYERVTTILPDVEQVVLTALAKDPKQRFGSVQTFAHALEQASGLMMVSPADHPFAVTPPKQQTGPSAGGPPASQVLQPMGPGASEPSPVQPALSTESARPTELAIPPDQSPRPLEFVMQAQQTVLSAETKAPSNQTSGPTGVWTPAGKASLPANGELSTSQSMQPPVIVRPPSQAVPQVTPSPSGVPYASRGVSRRAMILGFGLVGLAVAGSGLAWLVSSRTSLPSSILHISELLPSSGAIGAVVTVHGGGFTPQNNYIHFGVAYIGSYPSNNGTTLQFTIPVSATGGCNRPDFSKEPRVHCMAVLEQITKPQPYYVSVINENGESNVLTFTVTSSGSPN